MLNRIKNALSENVNLPADTDHLLRATHDILTDTLDPDRRAYFSSHSEHITDGIHKPYVHALHNAIGASLGMHNNHPPGAKGGPVNWARPKHKIALMHAAKEVFRGINARYGSPYNYGPNKATRADVRNARDNEFQAHIDKLTAATKGVASHKETDTDRKLANRSR